jgi:hypothetical protein
MQHEAEAAPTGRRRRQSRDAADLIAMTAASADASAEPITLPTPAAAARDMTAVLASKAERLSGATDMALGIVERILQLGVTPDNLKLLALVKDTALTIIGQQIRVDESRMRGGTTDRSYEAMLRSIEAAQPTKADGAQEHGG